MVDSNIVGCNWIELPPKSYRIRGSSKSTSKSGLTSTSHCQIEVDVAVDKLISHEPEGNLTLNFFFN